MRYEKSKQFAHHRISVLWALLIMVMFVGCTVSQPNASNRNSGSTVASAGVTPEMTTTVLPPSPTSVEVLTYTATSVPSIVPTQIMTETPLPTITATPPPPITPPTLTPISTISPQQRGQVYNEFMSNNGNCELPCWWGIELGKSTLDEVRQFYKAFDIYAVEQTGKNGLSVFYAQFVDPQIENGIQVGHTFIAQDDIVIEAEIQTHNQPEYQITPLLKQLGQPSEVWMWTIPEPFEGSLPARFRLYFPEKGVFMVYATEGMKHNDVVDICFDGLGGTALLLWNPTIWDADGSKGIVERANEGSSGFRLEGFSIKEASSWDVEQFYNVLTDPNLSECLETPSNLWAAP